MKNETTANVKVGQIVDDAEALLAATAHIADDSVMAARSRLTAVLRDGREMLENFKGKAISGAKATDEAIREHPYPAIGVALGVGALVGFLLGRRN
jgi:ElaB/YqjD/DUF883 family membrane-anchored ribosome-binding protein